MYGVENLLEEEMIVDELFLVFLAHTFERVELSFKITFESFASLDDLAHDLKSLLFADTWTKRVIGKISSNSDSCRVYHSLLLWCEVSVLKSFSCHVRNVGSIWGMVMIVRDNLIKKLVELVVSIMRSGIETNARILVCNSRENAHLK